MINKVHKCLIITVNPVTFHGWNKFNLTVDLSINSCIRSSLGKTVRTKSLLSKRATLKVRIQMAINESCEIFVSDEESIILANLEEMKQKLSLMTTGLVMIQFIFTSKIGKYIITFDATQPTLTIDPHLNAKTSFHNNRLS